MSGRYKASRDAHLIPYHVARGDELLQDRITDPATIRKGLDMLAQYGGDLAYTPEMLARFQEVFMRRFETNEGREVFDMPNYALYEDPDMAAFYGVNTSDEHSIQERKETFDEVVDRLLLETVNEIQTEMVGLAEMMQHYNREGWARYGVAAEAPYSHVDPDVTLFRNPDHGWSTMAIAAATSEKSNVMDLYEVAPDYVFPTPHPGWQVDRRGAFYNNLENDDDVAYGF